MSLSVKTFFPNSESVLNKMVQQNWEHAEILKILATLTDNHNALFRKVFEIKFCIYEQFFPNVNWQIFGQPFRDNSKFQIKNTLTNFEAFYSKSNSFCWNFSSSTKSEIKRNEVSTHDQLRWILNRKYMELRISWETLLLKHGIGGSKNLT